MDELVKPRHARGGPLRLGVPQLPECRSDYAAVLRVDPGARARLVTPERRHAGRALPGRGAHSDAPFPIHRSGAVVFRGDRVLGRGLHPPGRRPPRRDRRARARAPPRRGSRPARRRNGGDVGAVLLTPAARARARSGCSRRACAACSSGHVDPHPEVAGAGRAPAAAGRRRGARRCAGGGMSGAAQGLPVGGRARATLRHAQARGQHPGREDRHLGGRVALDHRSGRPRRRAPPAGAHGRHSGRLGDRPGRRPGAHARRRDRRSRAPSRARRAVDSAPAVPPDAQVYRGEAARERGYSAREGAGGERRTRSRASERC